MITIQNKVFSNEVKGVNPNILFNIHLSEKNIAIYKRDTLHLQNDVKHLLQFEIEFHHSGSVQEIQSSLKEYFKPLLDDRNTLFNDIAEALILFQRISRSQSFRVLLATVNTNMCRRFHTDMNDLRLLCTYYGQGTLWLPEEAINRNALGTCGDNECIVTDNTRIQQVAAGDIVVLKGAIYPKDGTKAVVHRSPTIEESGEKRLLLRIDTNHFLNV